MVDDVRDLPRWMKRAEPTNRDAVLAAQLRVAETDRRAFVVLAWLLVPGASLCRAQSRSRPAVRPVPASRVPTALLRRARERVDARGLANLTRSCEFANPVGQG